MGAGFHDVGLRFGGNAFYDFQGLSRGRCDEVECHDSDAAHRQPDGPRPSLVGLYFSDGTDDGIDHNGADLVVERCRILRLRTPPGALQRRRGRRARHLRRRLRLRARDRLRPADCRDGVNVLLRRNAVGVRSGDSYSSDDGEHRRSYASSSSSTRASVRERGADEVVRPETSDTDVAFVCVAVVEPTRPAVGAPHNDDDGDDDLERGVCECDDVPSCNDARLCPSICLEGADGADFAPMRAGGGGAGGSGRGGDNDADDAPWDASWVSERPFRIKSYKPATNRIEGDKGCGVTVELESGDFLKVAKTATTAH